MYFKVRINGSDFGVFGHPNVLNMNLSVQWTTRDGIEGTELFASAVCMEGGKRFLYDWAQHRLSATDVVEIAPTDERDVPKPRVKYEMTPKSADE